MTINILNFKIVISKNIDGSLRRPKTLITAVCSDSYNCLSKPKKTYNAKNYTFCSKPIFQDDSKKDY